MRKNNVKLKYIVEGLINILLIGLVILLLYVNIAHYFFGQIVLAIVKGISMYPLLRENDLVVILPPTNILPGDVIVFKNDRNEYVIHRVIAIAKCRNNGRVYITKGDNNLYIDSDILSGIAFRTSKECNIKSIEILKGYEDLINSRIFNNLIRGIPEERIVGKALSLFNMTIRITGITPIRT